MKSVYFALASEQTYSVRASTQYIVPIFGVSWIEELFYPQGSLFPLEATCQILLLQFYFAAILNNIHIKSVA